MRTLFTLALFVVLAAVFQTPIAAIRQETAALKILRFNWRERPPVDRKLQESQNAALETQLELERRKNEQARQKTDGAPRNETRTQRDDEKLEILKRQKQTHVIRDQPPAANKPYEYKLRVRNTGSKTVSGFQWVYIFTDPVTRKELVRRRFESKAEIRPGKEKELTVYTDSGPPNVINVKAKVDKKGSAWEEAVVIESVQFSDGTR